MKKIDLKKSRFGRVLRRLAGERKGAVLMEYVMLGALIAAAVVGAVFMMAHAITNSGNTVAAAITGSGQQVVQGLADTARTDREKDAKAAIETTKKVNGEE